VALSHYLAFRAEVVTNSAQAAWRNAGRELADGHNFEFVALSH